MKRVQYQRLIPLKGLTRNMRSATCHIQSWTAYPFVVYLQNLPMKS